MPDVTVLAERRLGAVLRGKYRLDRVIGVGGMAAVYAGRHLGVGKDVAVKVLHPHVSLSAEMHARFLREGLVANQVDHPGVVRVLDNDTTEDGSAFLVMELLEGETLDSLAQGKGGRLPPNVVARLARPLLEVLAAAHDKGIVHRDIKPANLLLTRSGVLKVLDFGIARFDESVGTPTATRTGRTMGTPAFMAPEQALGKQREIDARTDLWAVGATLFSLLAGQFVHESENPQALVVYSGSKRARPLADVAPETPAPIAAVIDRALLFEQNDRWASAREMVGALEAAYLTAFGEPLGDTSPAPPAPVPELREPPRAAAVLDRVPAPNISTTMGVAGGGSARETAPAGRRARWAIGATVGSLAAMAVVVALRTHSLGARPAQESPAASTASAAASNGGSGDGTELAFDCHLMSAVYGVGSMTWMRGALFLLAANPVKETIDLIELPLDDRTSASPAGAKVVHSFPIHQCTGAGKLRTCGFVDSSGSSPLYPDGERLVFAISFDASSCNRPAWKECDWDRSTCGSVWSLDLADLQLHSLSKEEAWITGIASDGARLFWARSYPQTCSPPAIRMYQSGTAAVSLRPLRPDDEDDKDWAEGGGLVVIGGRLSWLSSGVRRWTDGGLATPAPSQGVLYEAPRAYADARQEMEPHVVASGLERPGHLVSDGHSAYFATMDGSIYRFEGEILSTIANLGAVEALPMLATARTKRGRFLVAATQQKLVAFTPNGEALATDQNLGPVRALAAESEGQASTIVAYAASEQGVWACEAK